jgi:hypothetical protein
LDLIDKHLGLLISLLFSILFGALHKFQAHDTLVFGLLLFLLRLRFVVEIDLNISIIVIVTLFIFLAIIVVKVHQFLLDLRDGLLFQG